ncbi:hypothetical protein LA324_05170 [Corynebacterium coyleae]|nr:hypothetical protein [Corynebacterium coyleae]UBI10001.1 hypothetical protein LA324_05170 [Corynebacterium coyleae]
MTMVVVFAILGWALLTQFSCDDGYVYINNETISGCVPYESIKETYIDNR